MAAVPAALNVSAYKFVTLRDLPALRERLLERAAALQLKGTVLLAEEGINLFLAGAPPCLFCAQAKPNARTQISDEDRQDDQPECEGFEHGLPRLR